MEDYHTDIRVWILSNVNEGRTKPKLLDMTSLRGFMIEIGFIEVLIFQFLFLDCTWIIPEVNG